MQQLASRARIAAAMRGGGAAAEGEGDLPEDVVLEILARVPGVADLFRCAAACRRWRALVSDRSFLRRRWPPGARHRSSLLGFFFNREDPAPATMAPAEENFVRAPRSVLRPGSPLLSTFVPGAGSAGILGRAAVVPLASHGGLLLVRLVDGTAVVDQEEGEEPAAAALDRLAVCDLNSGACHVLPPLHCGWFFDYFATSAYAVLPGSSADDSSAASSSFKVLVIGINEDKRQYYLRTCSSSSSSSSGCWSAPSKLFDPIEHGIFGPIKQRDAAVIVSVDQRGVRHYTAHWLLWDLAHFHALDVDAATGEASLHRLPVPPRDLPFHLYDMPRLAAAPDGAALSALCLLRNEGRLRVEVWTRRRRQGEDGGGELSWHHGRVVELQSRSKEMDGALCVCFGERSGTLLARDRERCLYVADLESRGGAIMEEVATELRVSGGCKTAIAVEIDWPALFACRLGRK